MADNFWSSAGEGVKDPKRGYRWLLFAGKSGIPSYILKKVSKPSFTVSETSHKYLNHTFWYPGRVEWNTVALTLADPVSPDAAAIVVQAIKNSGYSPATSFSEEPRTMSKAKSVGALGNIEIRQIDAEGRKIESWILHNAWIKDVKLGELDYESDDLVNVEVELRYDYAHMEIANGATNPAPNATDNIWKPGSE